MVKLSYTRLGMTFLVFIFVGGLIFAATRQSEQEGKIHYSKDCGIELPKPKGYVNDFIQIFTARELEVLDSIIGAHEKETTNQIAIISFDSRMMGSCDVDHYTRAIGNTWGVGHKNKNNGIVIGIAPSLRKMRIENGYGIEKIISDQETKRIIDSNFIPEFKYANYFEGTRTGLIALINLINSKKPG